MAPAACHFLYENVCCRLTAGNSLRSGRSLYSSISGVCTLKKEEVKALCDGPGGGSRGCGGLGGDQPALSKEMSPTYTPLSANPETSCPYRHWWCWQND